MTSAHHSWRHSCKVKVQLRSACPVRGMAPRGGPDAVDTAQPRRRTAVPQGLPGLGLLGGLVLLVAEFERPPASEVVGEGVKLSPGPAV